MTELLEGERLDDLQNGYKIIQDPQKFCFGIDAVLLADFARIGENQRVLDMGTGTGIVPVLLKARTKGGHFTGLEIQEECADMARRSVRYNHLEEDISIVTGDIKEAGEIFGNSVFDAVTCNPPYMIGQHGLKNPDLPKAIARHEILCTFEDVARQAARVLTSRGRLFLIHRPFRLAEIFATLQKYRLEPKRMRMVHSYVDREPSMVLIEALYGGKSRLLVEKPLIIYDSCGNYTQEIREIYQVMGHER
ncbi:MAG TPA: tRNA1(Val) (adenine(37)-N6)-methyltransferase [Candidatus Blautia gallistercoris]|uniref:tRNA1(Val) (Adenine(37)-N6)-methyltransferase n=1 Tax=Candidatus Blautia gallistercoris TaxID=2838490 RepID=A0A9D1WGV9_9FIRM|nr:tRNA1(Val) (adenine(37)-N6)-methyltransferase [Candidatus Blautia gallistercoris]